jgi:hypothetical protein
VSTHADDATVRIIVTARALLSAGPLHITLTARQGPVPGTWQYTLNDGTDHRAAHGRIASKASHLDVLRYAAGICATGYQPGTPERGLLEHFAASP